MVQRNPYSGVDPEAAQSPRERLILEMLPKVRFHALRTFHHINRCIELAELTSAGVQGLLEAVDRFDETKGVKFQTFADLRIQGAIKDALRKQDWASRGQRQKKKLYETTFQTLQQRLGRAPEEDEMAAELGLDMEQWRRFASEVQVIHLGTFSELQGEDDDRAEIRLVAAPDSHADPHRAFERQQLLTLLTDEISRLPEKEVLVLSLYYREELTMKEIGLVLGVTESRVSQIHNRAVLRLRSRLTSDHRP